MNNAQKLQAAIKSLQFIKEMADTKIKNLKELGIENECDNEINTLSRISVYAVNSISNATAYPGCFTYLHSFILKEAGLRDDETLIDDVDREQTAQAWALEFVRHLPQDRRPKIKRAADNWDELKLKTLLSEEIQALALMNRQAK